MSTKESIEYFAEQAFKDAQLAVYEYKELRPPVMVSVTSLSEATLAEWDKQREDVVAHNEAIYEARCRLRKHYHMLSGSWFGSSFVDRGLKSFLNKRETYRVRQPRAPRDLRAEKIDALIKAQEEKKKREDAVIAELARSGKLEKAIQFLSERGKTVSVDYELGSAVFLANDIATGEAIEKRLESGGMFDFDGQNCDECAGWDGRSRRCECGNRRVDWVSHGDFENPYVRGVAW